MNYEYDLERSLEEWIFALWPLVASWDEDPNVYSQSANLCKLKKLHNESLEKLSQLNRSRVFAPRLNGTAHPEAAVDEIGHRIVCLHKDSHRV